MIIQNYVSNIPFHQNLKFRVFGRFCSLFGDLNLSCVADLRIAVHSSIWNANMIVNRTKREIHFSITNNLCCWPQTNVYFSGSELFIKYLLYSWHQARNRNSNEESLFMQYFSRLEVLLPYIKCAVTEKGINSLHRLVKSNNA